MELRSFMWWKKNAGAISMENESCLNKGSVEMPFFFIKIGEKIIKMLMNDNYLSCIE